MDPIFTFNLFSICLDSHLRFASKRFLFFFSFSFFQAAVVDYSPVNSARVHCLWDPQTLLFNNFFIKNESHSTIHTFKNYFTTVFSIFGFQFSIFSKNKLYPNRPLIIEIKLEIELSMFAKKMNINNIFREHHSF